MKKLKLITDGVVHGATIVDEDGTELGTISEVTITERKPALTLVKVGNNPTPDELDEWRKVFEEAAKDGDFKVFSHESVTIEKFYPSGNVEIKVDLEK